MNNRMRRVAFLSMVLLAAAMGVVFPSGSGEAQDGPAERPYDIAVIIKATDSDFWQYVLVGARNYAAAHPEDVNVVEFGPPSEADIDQQVTILEDVLAAGIDAIVIASTSSDATVPSIERAVGMGIPVITIDNRVNTDVVSAHLATDNRVGGALAADKMVEQWEMLGIEPAGRVAVTSAMAGVQVLVDRDAGFINRMQEIAPDVEILATRYVDNDITVALAATEDMVTAHGSDLIGVFADNNHTGIGASRVIIEQNLHDEVVLVAFDSDPAEVEALRQNAIKALIVQDPYRMGYQGVEFAVRALDGESLPEYVDTGVTAVTAENMDQPEIQGLLDPFSREVE